MVNEYSKWLTKVGDEIGNWHSEIGNEGKGKAKYACGDAHVGRA